MAASLRRLTGAHGTAAAARTRRGPLGVVPALTLVCFLAPLGLGLVGTVAPSFGYLPALGGDTLSLAPWRDLFAEPALVGALQVTVLTGVLSTVAATGLALLLAAAWHGTRVFGAVRRLLTPMLAMPHAALAIGLAFLMAPSGWLVRLISPWATGWERPPDLLIVHDPLGLTLTLGLVVKETPFLLLMILAARQQIAVDRSLALARTMGYGPVAAWLKTVLPQLYPQIRLPIYAVLAYSLSVVDMALILGPTTPPTLAPLVLRWFNDPDLQTRFVAAAGAVLQFLLVAGGIALWRGGEWIVARLSRPWLSRGGRGGNGRWARWVSVILYGGIAALAAGAMAALAVWSVAGRWRHPEPLPTSWAPANWMDALPMLGGPAWTTLATGVLAALAASILTVGCLEHERRHGVHPTTRALWLLYLPLLIPQIAFLFGVQVLLVTVRLDGTWLALVWCHLLFVLPYVFLALADPWRALDERYGRTALCLGASPSRVFWRVTLPILLRPVLFAAAIGFSVSVAQYLPTLFAGAGRLVTLTTEAVALAGGADRRVIALYAFAQSALPFLGFAAAIAIPAMVYRRRRGLAG